MDDFKWSEEYRHQCEVRYVLTLRKYGNKFAVDYMNSVLKARGKKAYNQLNTDQIEQWSKGNRGDKGDWR
jgi:hypothetical protein